MSLFAKAALLNNEGVEALSRGNCKEAIVKLSHSIKWMKQGLSSQAEPGPKSALNKFEEEDTYTVELSEVDSSTTFNEAILIPSTSAVCVDDLQLHVYSAATIFNLALAHQILGEEYKAERLYAMVLKLLLDDHCHIRTAVMVKLASIYNISQIRFAKGDLVRAQQGLDELAGFLNSASWVFEEPDVQGLLINVLLLKAPKVAAAA